MRVSRRTFVVGAAAACASCRSGGDETSSPEDAPDGPAPARVADGEVSTRDLGAVDELAGAVGETGFHHLPESRAWITRLPADVLADVEAVYGPLEEAGMAAGFVALYQKCPHLGCRVPECVSAQRFECPCHGSVFNRVGEWVGGPAPRGMDRFRVTLVEGRLHLDTSTLIEGTERGVLTLPGDPAGPSCIP